MKERLRNLIKDEFSGEWGEPGTAEDGVPVIRTLNFNNDGTLNLSDLAYRKISATKVEAKRLRPGDTIIEKSGGGPNQPVGRVVYYNGPEDLTILCNNFTSVLRPDPEEVDPLFFNQLLRNNHRIGRTRKYQNKTIGIINLRLKQYLGAEVDIPDSVDDQRRIAALLNRAEGLIAQRKESLRLLDELVRSVFLEMFGDPATNPKGYKTRLLSEFYKSPKEGTKTGPFGSALKKEEYTASGIPVWVMDNIQAGGRFGEDGCYFIDDPTFDRLRGYAVQDGDIIISRAGTVGKMAVVRSSHKWSLMSTNLLRLRLNDKLRPEYFVALMTICKGRVGRLKVGPDGAFTHMGTGVLDKLRFPYPPPDLQDEFIRFTRNVDKLRVPMHDSAKALEQLYGSLSQRAFRGELAPPSGTETGNLYDHTQGPLPGQPYRWQQQQGQQQQAPQQTQQQQQQQQQQKQMPTVPFLGEYLKEVVQRSPFSEKSFNFGYLLKYLIELGYEVEYEVLRDEIFRALGGEHPYLKQTYESGASPDAPLYNGMALEMLKRVRRQ